MDCEGVRLLPLLHRCLCYFSSRARDRRAHDVVESMIWEVGRELKERRGTRWCEEGREGRTRWINAQAANFGQRT